MPQNMDKARQIGLFDAHCHPTDIMSATDQIGKMRAKALTIMATRAQDQDLVCKTAEQYHLVSKDQLANDVSRKYVIPSFGWHPWFSYQIFDDRDGKTEVNSREHFRAVLTPSPADDENEFLDSLPTTRPLSEFLRETESRLQNFPLALVGEIGLDRSFRVPRGPFRCPDEPLAESSSSSIKTGGQKEADYTPGSREGRPLTPYRVHLEHQKLILKAQLELAAKYKRAVSIHSVATHGVAFDVLQSLWKGHEKLSKSARKKQKKDAANAIDPDDMIDEIDNAPLPYPPRICMHSYSGPADALKQFLGPRVPADIYFSFSELVNFGSHNSDKAAEVIKAVPEDKILIESDLHCAGWKMDSLLEDILVRVCKIRGWDLEQGAKQLRQNWERFIFGPQE